MAEPRCSVQMSINGAGSSTLRARPISRRLLGVAALVSLAGGLAIEHAQPGRRQAVAPPGHARLAAGGELSRLPLTAQGAASASLGASEPAYRVSGARGRLTATNPAQQLRASFGSAGALVSARGTTVGFALRAVQFGHSSQLIAPVVPSAHQNRVRYAYGVLQAWYANGPLGLEQGFTIASSAAARRTGTLTLSLALSGNATPRLGEAGRSITLSHAGSPSLRYSGLVATDARGRVLGSSLQLRNGILQLRVDTRGARFPVRVDPFVQVGSKLTGSGEDGDGEFGFSVAISTNGTTAIVGAPADNGGAGAAFVFTRSGEGDTWVQQGPVLTGSGEKGEAEFGYSVALSGEGNTALIGGPGNYFGGAVWAFTRSGETWSQQGSKVDGDGGGFGDSVAISSSGGTGLVGAPHYGGAKKGSADGAAWLLTRSGEEWSLGVELGSSEEAKGDLFGTSVAFSSEATTALIGAPGDNGKVGAAWVFTGSGETWTQQGSKLTGAEEVGKGEFGSSVALSSDGDTALVGGPDDHSKSGAAWVFTRSGESWSQQGPKLTVTGTKIEDKSKGLVGSSVALSSDGETALIGGRKAKSGIGAAWLFTSSDASWTQGQKLVAREDPAEEEGNAGFGAAVALSGEGDAAIIGAPANGGTHADGVGAAWAFASE